MDAAFVFHRMRFGFSALDGNGQIHELMLRFCQLRIITANLNGDVILLK